MLNPATFEAGMWQSIRASRQPTNSVAPHLFPRNSCGYESAALPIELTVRVLGRLIC